MNTATKPALWRYVLLLLGIGFIGVGSVAGYYWFYRLAPMRHLYDSQWRDTHSPAAIWAEEQENYRRTNASPDVCWRGDVIGFYGDKAWTSWLIGNIEKEGRDFQFCGCTHDVLSVMTNQDVHNDRAAWIAWRRKHATESQEQWIQQGFAKYGVTVHLPPVTEDHEPLLDLLGNTEKDAAGNSKVPSAVKYNAFRWLRDSGFRWQDYIAAHPTWRSSARLAAGVCCYANYEGSFPRSHGVGLLGFAKPPTPPDVPFRSPLVRRGAMMTAYAAIFGGVVLGAVIVAVAVRMKRRGTPALDTDAGIDETDN